MKYVCTETYAVESWRAYCHLTFRTVFLNPHSHNLCISPGGLIYILLKSTEVGCNFNSEYVKVLLFVHDDSECLCVVVLLGFYLDEISCCYIVHTCASTVLQQ